MSMTGKVTRTYLDVAHPVVVVIAGRIRQSILYGINRSVDGVDV